MARATLWVERALLPEGPAEGVRLTLEAGRIAACERDTPPASDDRFVHRNATLAPGLLDLQVNGADGAAYDDPDPAVRARATDWHLARGTTGLLATLVSAPIDHLRAALERLRADVERDPRLLGIHLEGPFLAEAKAGAHAPRHLCDPTPEAVAPLLAAAGDALRLWTLAPERAGALEAIADAARRGVVVAAGHSRATLAEMRAAADRGLSFVTHVGNASDWPRRELDPARGFRASEPGVVGSFLIEPRLRGGLILDGFHVHPELAAALIRLRGRDAICLVSDAAPFAGLPPGDYALGGLEARVHAGGWATSGEGLAGSMIALLDAVRIAVTQAGVALADAVHMASATPAAVLGIGDRKGRLAPGADADLLVLDAELRALEVWRGGEPVPGARDADAGDASSSRAAGPMA